MKKCFNKKTPFVGFFPPTVNLSETGRTIQVAKKFIELGGKAIFFSHGGKYDFLIKENDFELIKVKPNFSKNMVKDFFKIVSAEKSPQEFEKIFDYKFLDEVIENEIEAFTETKIDAVVSANLYSCSISARAAGIPYINILAGSGNCALRIPDIFENSFTFLIPQTIKRTIFNWRMLHVKIGIKQMNKFAKKYNLSPFKNSFDIIKGDYTFVIGIEKLMKPYKKNKPPIYYPGIILIDNLFSNQINSKEGKQLDKKIQDHIMKPGKSILVTLGSSGTEHIFTDILETFSNTEYNIIASHASILNENNMPSFDDNILLVKYIPSILKINKMVDLAIIHGGQGTVYTSVYAKKPVIGIPMHIEQHFNLERIEYHGMGIMVSNKMFNKEILENSVNKIFNNYNYYFKNAIKLGDSLPDPTGDIKAAHLLFDILN